MNPNVEPDPAAAESNAAMVTAVIDKMVKNATTFLEAYRATATEAITKASNGDYTADMFVSDAVKLWALAFEVLPRPQPGGAKVPP